MSYEKVPFTSPSIQELNELVGRFASKEAGISIQIAVDGDSLAAIQDPGGKTPVY